MILIIVDLVIIVSIVLLINDLGFNNSQLLIDNAGLMILKKY